MNKKCKVVMLPATDNGKIGENKIGDICKFSYGLNIAGKSDLGYPVQHLYILSNDEIKEDDWYFAVLHNHVWRAPKGFVKSKMINPKSEYKIIATTDSSLSDTSSMFKHLHTKFPSIPQTFIDKYISEYNKGNVITEMMVEYDEYALGEKLTLNPDNTINIKSVKDSWTREEVITICKKAYLDIQKIPFKEWIETNL